MSGRITRVVCGALLLLAMLGAPRLAAAAPAAPTTSPTGRYIVFARSAADYDNLRAAAQRAGAAIVKDIRDGDMFVVNASPAARAAITASGLVEGVAQDHVQALIPSAKRADSVNTSTI